MRRVVVAIALLALALGGCKRQKPAVARRVWLGPHGGCMQTQPHPKVGELACWGKLPGDATAASFAQRRELPFGVPSDMSIGEHLACAVQDKRAVYCWSDKDGTPTKTEDEGSDLAVRVGAEHACVRSGERLLRCFGANDQAQLGGQGEWSRGSKVRAFALGKGHTCAAYEGMGVICRGADAQTSGHPIVLGRLDAIALAAGDAHTCALLANRTVVCWGRNDAGQLGDHTTTDSIRPVAVPELSGVAAIAAGSRHTCALVGNGTVHCWGNNAHHQLANGETKDDATAKMVLGVLNVQEISASAQATCARLGKDGEIRCWGKNDEGQLGDDSREEHTVPAAIKFH